MLPCSFNCQRLAAKLGAAPELVRAVGTRRDRSSDGARLAASRRFTEAATVFGARLRVPGLPRSRAFEGRPAMIGPQLVQLVAFRG